MTRPPTRHPRLKTGIAVSTTGGALTFLGTARSKTITGEDALSLVFPVVQRLDGTCGWAQIATATGLSGAVVGKVAGLLRAENLLDEASGEAPSPIAAFLAEHLEVDVTDETVGTILDRIAGAGVGILADPGVAARLAEDLTACGFGSVRILGTADEAEGIELAIVSRHLPQASTVVERMRRRGITVQTFASGSQYLEIGPTFTAASNGCPRCYTEAAVSRFGGGSQAMPEEHTELICGLVGLEAFAIVAGHVAPASVGAVVRYVLPGYTSERYLLVGEPTCASCAPTPTALIEMVEGERESIRPLPVSAAAAREKLVESLERARPAFVFHPRFALPPTDVLAAPERSGLGLGLGFGDVAPLLQLTAGRREPGAAAPLDRFAASGGNQGSVQLFAVFGTPVLDHPAGTVFRYDDLEHELVVPRNQTVDAPGAGSLRLVLVADVGRLVGKYRDFGMRLAFLDAGCALAQLRNVATHLRLRAEPADHRDPRLADQLELRPGRELVTADVTLSHEDPAQEE